VAGLNLALSTDQERLIQLHFFRPTSTLLTAIGFRMVHEYAAQNPRRYCEKMNTILPCNIPRQPGEISLID
jgi:hypothetical protein